MGHDPMMENIEVTISMPWYVTQGVKKLCETEGIGGLQKAIEKTLAQLNPKIRVVKYEYFNKNKKYLFALKDGQWKCERLP